MSEPSLLEWWCWLNQLGHHTASCGQSGNGLLGVVDLLLEVRDVELFLAHLLVVIIVTLLVLHVLHKGNHVINHCDERVHADLLAFERQGEQIKAVIDVTRDKESGEAMSLIFGL